MVRSNWVEKDLEIEGNKITIRFNIKAKTSIWHKFLLAWAVFTRKDLIGLVLSRVTEKELVEEELKELENLIDSKKAKLERLRVVYDEAQED